MNESWCTEWPFVFFFLGFMMMAVLILNPSSVCNDFLQVLIWAISWDMVLFVLHKFIIQTRMHNHPVRLDVWYLIGPFSYFHTLCLQIAKALVRLSRCAGTPDPSLVAYVISAIISWAGSFIVLQNKPDAELQIYNFLQFSYLRVLGGYSSIYISNIILFKGGYFILYQRCGI